MRQGFGLGGTHKRLCVTERADCAVMLYVSPPRRCIEAAERVLWLLSTELSAFSVVHEGCVGMRGQTATLVTSQKQREHRNDAMLIMTMVISF